MQHNHYYLSRKLGQMLLNRGLVITSAESCTGGSLANVITRVPGCSSWFRRSFVVYSNIAKVEMLSLKQEILDKFGAVSKQTAVEMAVGAIKHSHADMAISITGISGPAGGSDIKPVGTVWFGLAFANGQCECRTAHFYGGRQHVRDSSISFALEWMIEELQRYPKTPFI